MRVAPVATRRMLTSWMSLVLAHFLSGAGLAFSAGLNAYLPLLVLALADRISGSVELDGRFDFLSSNAGILLLLVLLPIELVGDKIPRLDHVNDLLHSVLRPLAGAIAFAAIASQDDDLNPWIAAALGLLVSGAMHAWKMRSRPHITERTRGFGNPYASLVEDFVAIVTSLMAMIAPWGVPIAIALGVALVHRTYNRLTSGASRVVRLFAPRS